MLKTNKLNGLIATYRDNASSEAEMYTAKKMAVKLIEKELGCKRWISTNIVKLLAYRELFVNSCMQQAIIEFSKEPQDTDVVKIVVESVRKLGFNVEMKARSYHGKDSSQWGQQINIY